MWIRSNANTLVNLLLYVYYTVTYSGQWTDGLLSFTVVGIISLSFHIDYGLLLWHDDLLQYRNLIT